MICAYIIVCVRSWLILQLLEDILNKVFSILQITTENVPYYAIYSCFTFSWRLLLKISMDPFSSHVQRNYE